MKPKGNGFPTCWVFSRPGAHASPTMLPPAFTAVPTPMVPIKVKEKKKRFMLAATGSVARQWFEPTELQRIFPNFGARWSHQVGSLFWMLHLERMKLCYVGTPVGVLPKKNKHSSAKLMVSSQSAFIWGTKQPKQNGDRVWTVYFNPLSSKEVSSTSIVDFYCQVAC